MNKAHMAMAARILAEPRSRRRYKTEKPIVSIVSHKPHLRPINPYATASIVGAVDAIEGNVPFGKFGSRDMHTSL